MQKLKIIQEKEIKLLHKIFPELKDVLDTYYLDDNTYIVVYTNGNVRLFSNYYDISDNEVSKFMKINIGDKVEGYCRKLVLSNN